MNAKASHGFTRTVRFWNMVFVLALTHFSVVQSVFQNIMRDCGGMDAIACLIHDTTMVCALHHNHNNHWPTHPSPRVETSVRLPRPPPLSDCPPRTGPKTAGGCSRVS